MIIKIIPETEAEQSKHKEISYEGVKEFFLFGNKRDADDVMVDFHEWEGGYRYLIGSLNYFYNEINDERRESYNNKATQTIPFRVSQVEQPTSQMVKMVKRGGLSNANLEIIQAGNFNENVEGIDANEEMQDAEDVVDKGDEDVKEAFPENDFPENEQANNVVQLNQEELESLIKRANKKYGKEK